MTKPTYVAPTITSILIPRDLLHHHIARCDYLQDDAGAEALRSLVAAAGHPVDEEAVAAQRERLVRTMATDHPLRTGDTLAQQTTHAEDTRQDIQQMIALLKAEIEETKT